MCRGGMDHGPGGGPGSDAILGFSINARGDVLLQVTVRPDSDIGPWSVARAGGPTVPVGTESDHA